MDDRCIPVETELVNSQTTNEASELFFERQHAVLQKDQHSAEKHSFYFCRTKCGIESIENCLMTCAQGSIQSYKGVATDIIGQVEETAVS